MTTYNQPPRVITVPTIQPSAGLTTFDTDFGANETEELIVRPTQKPWLQWMTGKLTTTTFETPVGWHIQAEVDPDLDELLASMQVKRYVVQHPSSSNGEAKQVPYWALNAGERPCSLFVIAYGVASSREMDHDHHKRFGIAYGWEVLKDKQGQVIRRRNSTEPKRQCRVQFRACVHKLVERGYLDWFQVSISGYLTDDILAAFHAQYRVMDAFDGRMRAQGSDVKAPFWAHSIPFVPGAARYVQPKDGGDGTNIIPMVTQIPRRIEEITIPYLNQHRIPRDLQKRVRDYFLDDAFVWSATRSLEIYGEQNAAMSALPAAPLPLEHKTVSSPPPMPLPPPIPADAISATQVKWIKDMCDNNLVVIQTWCEKFQIPDLTHLRSSQFIDLFNLMSQDHQ